MEDSNISLQVGVQAFLSFYVFIFILTTTTTTT